MSNPWYLFLAILSTPFFLSSMMLLRTLGLVKQNQEVGSKLRSYVGVFLRYSEWVGLFLLGFVTGVVYF